MRDHTDHSNDAVIALGLTAVVAASVTYGTWTPIVLAVIGLAVVGLVGWIHARLTAE